MSTPDIAEVFYQQRAEHCDNADDNGSNAKAHGALVVDSRAQLGGAQDGERTQEYETDTHQCSADAHDGLITMNAQRQGTLDHRSMSVLLLRCILTENAVIMTALIGRVADACLRACEVIRWPSTSTTTFP